MVEQALGAAEIHIRRNLKLKWRKIQVNSEGNLKLFRIANDIMAF